MAAAAADLDPEQGQATAELPHNTAGAGFN